MIRRVTLLLSALLLSGAVHAEMNIVVLDTVRAILESDEAKVLIEAAEKEMSGESDELRGLADQRKTLAEKVQKDGDVLSQADLRDIQKDIEEIELDLQYRSQKLQKAVQDKRQEILVALAPKFEKVRNDLVQVEGYDMIIAPNAMVYVNPKNDITRRVTERMNENKNKD